MFIILINTRGSTGEVARFKTTIIIYTPPSTRGKSEQLSMHANWMHCVNNEGNDEINSFIL